MDCAVFFSMVSHAVYFVIVIVIAAIGAYLFFADLGLPMCEDADECDFRECPQDEYRDCVNGRCVCLSEEEQLPDY